MLDSTPIMPVTMKWLLSKAVLSVVPSWVSTPITSKQATAIRMPRKKRMVLMSMREMMFDTRFCMQLLPSSLWGR